MPLPPLEFRRFRHATMLMLPHTPLRLSFAAATRYAAFFSLFAAATPLADIAAIDYFAFCHMPIFSPSIFTPARR